MEQQSQEMVITGPILGKGKFGLVTQGFWNKIPVAIKQQKRTGSVVNEKTLREIRIHRGLKHPHIVALVSVRQDFERIYIILELMTGGTLHSIIHNKTIPLGDPIRESIIRDIITGLDYLHDAGILHRDIKSTNVLLDSQMRGKISDFGFAIPLSEVGTCSFAGTPTRLAPELIKPSRDSFSTKTDIFSFGILVSELVRRELPYMALEPISICELYKRIVEGVRDEIPVGTPAVLSSIIISSTAASPDRRPSTKKIISMLSATKQLDVKPSCFEFSHVLKQNISDGVAEVLCEDSVSLVGASNPTHSFGIFSARRMALELESSTEEETATSRCPWSCVIQ